MSTWTIPDGASESNSVWFGLEAILAGLAPAMTATTDALQLQASSDPMSTPDSAATFADCTVAGTLAKLMVSTSAGRHDSLSTPVRAIRARVKAVTTGDVAVAQSGAKAIEALTIRL